MMTYLLQVSTCWIVLYAIYILFLQKETFFSINRYYLLSALVAGLMIPLLGGFLPANQTSTEIYQVMSQVTAIEITPNAIQEKNNFTWLNLLYTIYAIVSLIVLSRFFYGLSKIYSIYKNAIKTKYTKYTLVESSTYHLPFSFFQYIFISKSLPLNEDIEKVLKHEELHANQWHSLDIIITELLQVFFWFNPILIFYKHALRQSHEYLADAYVAEDHNKSSYGQLLLRQSTSGLEIALANHFFHSQIKKRITMLYKEKSKRPAMVKYLAAIPVLAAMLFIFSSSQMNNHIKTDSDSDSRPVNVVDYDSNSSDEVPIMIPEDQNDPIFKVVEEMPRFPGCESDQRSTKDKNECARQEMLNFIYKNLQYPEEALKAEIEGMTVIQFVIEKDGTISAGKIVRNVEGGCGKEALKVVNSMPKWIPGKQKGKTVRVQYTLPVKFKLESKTSDEKENEIVNVVGFGKKSDEAIKANLTIQNSTQKNSNSEDLYKVVEEMPRFPGCENLEMTIAEKEECAKGKMLEFIYTQIKYPKEARSKGIEGIVVIQMIIEKDGSVTSSQIVRNPGGGTGTEAKRIIDLMPKWTPGKQRGKNVRVQYTLPIKYKLQDDKKTDKANDDTKEKVEKEVDQKPLFPESTTEDESTNNLLNFVFKNVKYPKQAIENEIEGLALVKFIIGTDGIIRTSKLVKSPGWGIGQEVLKMIDNLKEIDIPWTPATLDGQNVYYEYVLPVKFKLQDDQIQETKSRKLNLKVKQISPNPSNGVFTLVFDVDDKTPANIMFYSLNGQLLKSLKNVSLPFNQSIDMTEFSGQTVFLNIIQKDKIHSEKIIIQ